MAVLSTRSRLLSAALAAALPAILLNGTTPAYAASNGPHGGERIVVTEQATGQILLLDADRQSWRNAKVLWRWRPSVSNGLGDLMGAWGLPDEAKLRHRRGQAYLLTAGSYGLAAVVPYPQGGRAYWAADVGRRANPHSVELLPDGNVAVVASHGDWLRVYTASEGPRASSYAQFDLRSGHGVFWDGQDELLWALGGRELVALRVEGRPDRPVLREVRRTALPSRNGHDLQPVATRPGRLWVTTDTGVYQYSPSRDEFLQDYPGAERISVAGVKSVGDLPRTGEVLTTVIQRGNLCTWCTDSVTLGNRGQNLTLHGAQIYKARWWIDPATRTRPGGPGPGAGEARLP